MDSSKVLIVTDGLLSLGEPSPVAALRKQLQVHRNSAGPWLDLRVKLQILERVLPAKLFMRSRKASSASFFPTANRLLSGNINLGAPELTEVVLMTLLEAEGVSYEATTYSELAANASERERLLASTNCVFASATMLRGLPEVRVVAKLLKRSHNRVMLGGALTAVLHDSWPGVPGIDLLAVGYGEWLVPALVSWIRSGCTTLEPPPRGNVVYRGDTPILYSGLPAGRNLDKLIRPDWSLAERYHGRKFPLVHYESVRGCPYRCQFCNYPYLFADDVFRTKSAERIAKDWIEYAGNGARIINCLDSLFTVPRKRLLELCDALEGKNIRWICYARADDLARPGIVERMLAAGCTQVQIGIESGDQQILDNMNKRCTVESNLQAMKTCRELGLSTVVSVIIGFPGETTETVNVTLDHLRSGMPDFYYASPLSVLVQNLPLMSEESRRRFGLQTNGGNSSSPYWSHDTMDAAEAIRHVGRFNETMMKDNISLEAGQFYAAMPDYRRETDRDDLLAYQQASINAVPWLRTTLRFVGGLVQRRLENDMVDTANRKHLDWRA
jgi:radical SAM superfamily enzyme YgiQ (UPF0313 family)